MERIVKVLQILMEYDALTYMFLPEYGGDQLLSLEIGFEKDVILINDDFVLRSRRLLFELIKDDLQWSYFRLEFEFLESITGTSGRMELSNYVPDGYTLERYAKS